MPKRRPVIITCAVTGAILTPSMSPHLPAASEAIVASAVEAAQAGAAILHLHARDDATGKPDQTVEGFGHIVPQIAAQTGAILNLTTGPGGRYVPSDDDPAVAGPGTTLLAPEKRVAHIVALKPEICTLDFNTMWSGQASVIAGIMAAVRYPASCAK